MFGQLCVALCVPDGAGEGVAAVPADPALTAVVAAPDDEDVDEVVCVVVALATAMLAPNPAPSAPAPMAVPMMIGPSLVFMCPPPRGRAMVLRSGHPPKLRAFCGDALSTV
jgi:hypothetical protein